MSFASVLIIKTSFPPHRCFSSLRSAFLSFANICSFISMWPAALRVSMQSPIYSPRDDFSFFDSMIFPKISSAAPASVVAQIRSFSNMKRSIAFSSW